MATCNCYRPDRDCVQCKKEAQKRMSFVPLNSSEDELIKLYLEYCDQ